jgi:hypothetical protein
MYASTIDNIRPESLYAGAAVRDRPEAAEARMHDVSLTRTTTPVDADCLLRPATGSTVFSKRTQPSVDNRRLISACPQSGQTTDVLVRPLSADIVAKVAEAPLWNSNLKQSNRGVRTFESLLRVRVRT